MSRIYLKKAQLTAKSNASEVHETVKNILTDIEAGGDSKAKEYASKFDCIYLLFENLCARKKLSSSLSRISDETQ